MNSSAPNSYSYGPMIQDVNKSTAPGTVWGLSFQGSQVNPLKASLTTSGSSLSTVKDTLIGLETGVTSNSFIFLQSTKLVEFDKGEDITIKFSAIFPTTPLANTSTLIGVGSTNNGLFFGYDGVDFGVLRRKAGVQESQVVYLGGPATASGELAVVLADGSANVVVTSGDTVSQIASYISSTDFSTVSGGWSVSNIGNGASFTAMTSGTRSGVYQLTSGLTGVAGTFAQIAGGVPSSDTWTHQAAWNVDKAGDLSTLEAVDFAKGQSYQIKFDGDGFGRILYSMRSQNDGQYYPVHIDNHLNGFTAPATYENRLPLMMYAGNGDSGANVAIQSTMMSAEISPELIDDATSASLPKFVTSSNIANLTVPKVVETNILSLRNGSLPNTLKVKLYTINYAYTGSSPIIFTMSKGVSYSNAAYAYLTTDVDSVTTYFNYGSSPNVRTNGGRVMRQWLVTNGTSAQIDVTAQEMFLLPGEELSIHVRPLNNSNIVSSDFSISLMFVES